MHVVAILYICIQIICLNKTPFQHYSQFLMMTCILMLDDQDRFGSSRVRVTNKWKGTVHTRVQIPMCLCSKIFECRARVTDGEYQGQLLNDNPDSLSSF
jgi:hypothetical protein